MGSRGCRINIKNKGAKLMDTSMVSRKPQVILRLQDEYGVHLIKKWPLGYMTIEGHAPERATNHNMNVPEYCFPVDDAWATELFKEAGKEYRRG